MRVNALTYVNARLISIMDACETFPYREACPTHLVYSAVSPFAIVLLPKGNQIILFIMIMPI